MVLKKYQVLPTVENPQKVSGVESSCTVRWKSATGHVVRLLATIVLEL